MGYVHDTHMSQYIPPTAFHIVTGTWTQTAGVVTDTICMHKAATAETATVNIPIMLPSNASAEKGSLLKSIEVDYEIVTKVCTSVTAILHKIVRGVDGAVAVESEPAVTQDLTASTDAADVDQHKLTVTVTTPVWIDNDAYYLLELAMIAQDTTTIDLLGAVVNYTLRV